MGKIKSKADKILENAYFDGKVRNFTLENYCKNLKRAFTDLDECGDELTDSCKVRIFMRGLCAQTYRRPSTTSLDLMR